jgi:hypothetical protein
MAVTLYKSTDTSAPTLNGNAGSLITVLDAILVNGYGSQAAAGWTKSYSGANGADYRSGSGTQYYLDVNDNGPGAGTGKEARIRGYAAMTAFQTGTNAFPTAAQLTNGLFVRKSATADGTARAWKCIADNKTFYFFARTTDIANNYLSFMFGDIKTLSSPDSNNCVIVARTTENNATSTPEQMSATCNLNTTLSGHYIAGDYLNTIGSILWGKHGDLNCALGNADFRGSLKNSINGYNGADTGIHLAPIWVIENSNSSQTHRGRLRGLWHFLNDGTSASFNDGDTFSGSGALAGKTFELIKYNGAITANSQVVWAIETSNTWE